MLTLTQLAGFGTRRRRLPIGVIDLGTQQDTGNDASSAFSFGAAPQAGRLVACITTRDGAVDYTANPVNIGGVGAAIHVDTAGANVTSTVVIASRMVAAGESCDVAVTWSEAVTNDQLCTALLVIGTDPAPAPFHSASQSTGGSGTTATASLNAPARGIGIAVAANGGPDAISFGGTGDILTAVEAADQAASDGQHQHAVLYAIYNTAATPDTVTASQTSQSNKCIGAVSFAEEP